jgi:hypothetical protein
VDLGWERTPWSGDVSRLVRRGEGTVYFTDRGLEELAERRGEETVTVEWLAERLRDFIDANPEFETPIERFATWLARLDDED